MNQQKSHQTKKRKGEKREKRDSYLKKRLNIQPDAFCEFLFVYITI